METMKLYIGTKKIKATPMTKLEYNTYRGWILPDDEDGAEKGMLVEYTDGGKPNHSDHEGYISWSPLAVFKNAYRIAETYKDRIAIEMNDVSTKRDALRNAIESGTVPAIAIPALTAQLCAMRAYHTILVERLSESFIGTSFSIALIGATVLGKRITRSGWNGAGQYVFQVRPTVIEYKYELPIEDDDAHHEPCLALRNAKGDIVLGWAPSQGDLFANDWIIIY